MVPVMLHNSPLKCLQFNANHARAATAALAHYILQEKIDVALVQDPYLKDGHLQGFSNLWKKFSSEDKRSWLVLTSTSIKHTVLPAKHSSIYVVLETNDGPITIGSQYASPSADFPRALV